MNRRQYLATLCGGAAVSLAGCAAVDDLSSSLGGGSKTIGDTQSYNGVELTPTEYVLADSYTRNMEMNSQNTSAPSGATFVFSHLSVVHNGDSEQRFPENGMGSDDINLVYDGEEVGETMMDTSAQSYTVDGVTLKAWDAALYDADATGGVFPGKKVDGWIVHDVASNFDPEKLELRVIWNNQAVGEGEDEVTHKWTYTADAEVSIDNIGGSGGE